MCRTDQVQHGLCTLANACGFLVIRTIIHDQSQRLPRPFKVALQHLHLGNRKSDLGLMGFQRCGKRVNAECLIVGLEQLVSQAQAAEVLGGGGGIQREQLQVAVGQFDLPLHHLVIGHRIDGFGVDA